MTTITETKTEDFPTTLVEPEFDRTDGDVIADEMLMESASNAKVGKVQGRMGWRQSAESRAWTKSGNVD
jgi:hypothetical protein